MYEYLTQQTLNIEESTSKQQVLTILSDAMKTCAFSHYLFAIIPMPNQSVNETMILRDWKDTQTGRDCDISSHDVLIQKAVDWSGPIILNEHHKINSPMYKAARLGEGDYEVLIIPIEKIYDVQSCFICVFEADKTINGFKQNKNFNAMSNMTYAMRNLLRGLFSCAMLKLLQLDVLPNRSKTLTKRERETIELCAIGKTSADVAQALNISERTAIAHVQNSMNKLNAKNRVECVIQAIRYNQIGAGSAQSRDFYEILRVHT